jgi:hypothetical protein
MRSTMRAMLAASLLLAVAGCAGSPVIVASPSACAELIPAEWANGVDHTPASGCCACQAYGSAGILAWTLDELKKWTGFGVSEAAKVDQANGRTADAIGIVARCEARDAKAVKAGAAEGAGHLLQRRQIDLLMEPACRTSGEGFEAGLDHLG